LKTSTGTSLVVVKQQLVEQKYGRVQYRNTSTRMSGGWDAYQSGKHAGRNANLSRQVNGESQRRIANG
jgi:hypothetical protein